MRYVELTGIVTPHTHDVEETIFYIEVRYLAIFVGNPDL